MKKNSFFETAFEVISIVSVMNFAVMAVGLLYLKSEVIFLNSVAVSFILMVFFIVFSLLSGPEKSYQ